MPPHSWKKTGTCHFKSTPLLRKRCITRSSPVVYTRQLPWPRANKRAAHVCVCMCVCVRAVSSCGKVGRGGQRGSDDIEVPFIGNSGVFFGGGGGPTRLSVQLAWHRSHRELLWRLRSVVYGSFVPSCVA